MELMNWIRLRFEKRSVFLQGSSLPIYPITKEQNRSGVVYKQRFSSLGEPFFAVQRVKDQVLPLAKMFRNLHQSIQIVMYLFLYL